MKSVKVKRFSVVLALVVVLTSLLPVNAFAIPAPFNWDDVPVICWEDDLSDDAVETPVEATEISEEVLDGASEVTSGTNLEDADAISEEPINEKELEKIGDDTWSENQFHIMAEASKTERKPVDQPQFAPKSGYDVISVFLTPDDSTTEYTGKVFFIISGNGQWCLFDYKKATADKYLEKSELKNDMYLPVKTADSRKDNPDTKVVDEAKIPLMKKSEFSKMKCDWREFKDVPLTKDSSSNLVYATWLAPVNDDPKKDEPEKKDDPKQESKNPTTPSWNRGTDEYWYCYTNTTNRGNIYKVFVTKAVSYNGNKHVLVTGKSGKNKTNDIQVYVFLNGQEVPSNLYKVQFKNNKNCNGYTGNSNVRPYVRLKFKFKNKALKSDIKAMYKHGFSFDITPLDISKGSISYKSIRKGALKKAVWSGSGISVKLAAPNEEERTGDYRLVNENGRLYAEGRNNFYGKLMLGPASNAPGSTGNNGGGGQIY